MIRIVLLILLPVTTSLWSQEPSPKPTAGAGFGFTYKVPYGWVDRTAQMQSGDPGKAEVLLAIFERPPEAASDSVNSAVIIAAEPLSYYPGLKSAADYFGPLGQITTAKGFTVVNQPYAFTLGWRQLPRADYSKPLGKLTMHQSSLAILSKGYVVSFTFIAGSDDEVDHLIESLKLRPAKAVH